MLDYRIRNAEGFSEKIGELVSMLEHSRAVTLEEVKDLSKADLDHLVDGGSNSIGSLLLHIASIEYVHQVISFEKRDLSESELIRWKPALELGEAARNDIRHFDIHFYFNELAKVRLLKLKELNDGWLLEEDTWSNGVRYNNHYLWFHVMEDEINHRGQIRMLKRIHSGKSIRF
ncbi:DUF664 domain-containing protein [Bacillus mangrovi]|uniref:DUF664 domain-containing protein n=1 Tax=Metabacillus mangrovi TaxID=1491830 RepID=A0A7X2S903_9BACI|nr:DinB family protein [Metabacillus mangrovi]MTH54951.1 DUF664 domain-containing protein [Metabacillus mangrovi]